MKFTTYYIGMNGSSKAGVFMSEFKAFDGDTSIKNDVDRLADWIDGGEHYWAVCDGKRISKSEDIRRFLDI
jgi:hypothetical protein